ncbi:MAG: acyl-CoA dehydrogenase, partial [Gammaproteobacteria bacterium]
MSTWLEILTLLAAIWALAAWRTPLWVWLGCIGLCLIHWGSNHEPSTILLVLAWLLYLPAAFVLLIPGLRQQWISAPLLQRFVRMIPTMSDTEREALEAGTVGWDAELFSGRPDWRRLLDTPPARLSEEEQAFLDGPVEELCSRLDDWKITQQWQDLPEDLWQFIKDQGFFGLVIPKNYGGRGFSAYAHSQVVMKVATRSTAGAVTIMVPNSLGPAELLLHYGTDEQKDHYLPRLAKGEEVPCFALTGPEAGSDAGAMPDTGIVCRGSFDGHDNVLGIRLNWDKRYITLGPIATVLGLAFKLYDPDHLLGRREKLGITVALIPTDTPGIEIGNRHSPMGLAFQNGPNYGKDVFIPVEWIIGGPKRAGQGWRMLMESLAAGRGISLPALSTGAGKLVCRATGAYAAIRKQFKLPIGRFEGVAEALARIAGITYCMDAARSYTAATIDQGEKPAVASAILKYHLTEGMRQVVNDAMDIQGGSAICQGPRNLLGRVYQGLPISITVEGANILTRSLIIFGQGAVRCHPYVHREMRAVAARSVEEFDAAFFSHVGHTVSTAARTLFHGITRSRFIRTPLQGDSARYGRALTGMSAAFALVADCAMLRLGGALKRKESLSARLGDVLSQLYLATTALKCHYDRDYPEDDWPLVQWVCEDALYRAQTRFMEIFDNLPGRLLGALLRATVFPFGTIYCGPSDQLNVQVARCLMEPGEVRDRLTAGIFLPTEG